MEPAVMSLGATRDFANPGAGTLCIGVSFHEAILAESLLLHELQAFLY